MAKCNPDALMDKAKCFAGCFTPEQLLLIQTQLLCEILAALRGIPDNDEVVEEG